MIVAISVADALAVRAMFEGMAAAPQAAAVAGFVEASVALGVERDEASAVAVAEVRRVRALVGRVADALAAAVDRELDPDGAS